MRATSIFRRLLGLSKTVVRDIRWESGSLVLEVSPRWQRPRCSKCGRVGPGYDRRKSRQWRHLGVGRMRILLEYAPRRVECRRCGVVVEEVPWARPRSDFTRDFEEMTAFLAQVTDKTTVHDVMGVAWQSVGRIIERVVADHLDPKRLQGLKRIGIDEFSYRKRHRYVTVIVDHDRREVVWVEKGHGAKALHRFFDELGEEGCAAIEVVTMDMAAGYKKAVKERLPQAEVIFDRFHVQGIVKSALDEVRRQQLREHRGTEKGRMLFECRWALIKRPWKLEIKDEEKLTAIQEHNWTLYRAYLLYQSFAAALDLKTPHRAERRLREWLAWACRSRLRPFLKASRTIRKHLAGILRYLRLGRLTNALVEGLNNHIRVIARRAFGFHSAEALISMIYLCCGGVRLDPPLPARQTNPPFV